MKYKIVYFFVWKVAGGEQQAEMLKATCEPAEFRVKLHKNFLPSLGLRAM